MKKIDEQIQWYEQNANSLYDDMVSIELEKINSLYDRYNDHTDEMFVEEMIESFCKIIERQREKLFDLESEMEMTAGNSGFSVKPIGRRYMTAYNITSAPNEIIEDFQDDKQLQNAFTQYCLSNGTSSYTVNDYCSRIKKTWKSFEDDYRNGKLKDNLASRFPEISWDGALMNAYDNIEVLGEYVREIIDETEGNRNFLNARAALNKFIEFRSRMK